MLRYLWNWFGELFGRSGGGTNGYAPLTYTTVRDWAALTGSDPTGLEVEALMLLDTAVRTPADTVQASAEGEVSEADCQVDVPVWPTRKPAPIPSD